MGRKLPNLQQLLSILFRHTKELSRYFSQKSRCPKGSSINVTSLERREQSDENLYEEMMAEG